MHDVQTLRVPSLVRVKPGASRRIGIYLQRAGVRKAALFASAGLPAPLVDSVLEAIKDADISVARSEVDSGGFEGAVQLFESLPADTEAVLGIGGGKALDVAKYIAHLGGRPYYAIPLSLSNDGFASPQSSLTIQGRRRSLVSRVPTGVVIDTEVCQQAPDVLWHSGVGDLVARLTAVADWKLAYHHDGTPVNDLAALLSDATVMQFLARPERDLEGVRLLATALLLNGVAMELAGCSRPASGSEHLISHALDQISQRPRLHGLQVGVATYLVSGLQGGHQTERIGQLLDRTRFWDSVRADPFDPEEWRQAVERAPSLKTGFHTILSTMDAWPRIDRQIRGDPRLTGCFGF